MSSETADILFAQCHIAVRAVSPCRNVWTNVWMHRCWGWCRYCYQAKMPNIALCSTDDVKEVDKSDSNLFTDTVGLEGFLTCCNFLISQIYASFHLEPLVYKEMDTNLNNYRFLWTTKNSSLWPHIFHTARIFQFWWEPSAINIVWQQFEFTRCHGIPIKWASYCSNCEDKKKKKNRCLRRPECITSDRHIENVCASYTFWKLLAHRDKIYIRCTIHYTLCFLSQVSRCWSLPKKSLSPFLLVLSLIWCFSVS